MKKSLIALSVLAATSAFAGGGLEQIPSTAIQYRAALTREARAQWGLAAPVSTFAAQIHQESRWRNSAVSPVGARGLSQVMPATAAWLNQSLLRLPAGVAGSGTPGGDRTDTTAAPSFTTAGPSNPAWSLRALVTYDRWLWGQLAGADDCQHMAKTLRAYNGGLGWVFRDEKLARKRGINTAVNFGSLDQVNAGRSASSFAENVGYPRLILRTYEAKYIKAGFGPGVCA